jgi:hypothetical protein
MRKIWLRSILTAVLFSLVLTGAMWALDEFSGEEWLPWTKVAVSSKQAVTIAETKCFSPTYRTLKPWHTKLRDGRWAVWGSQKGRYWRWPSTSDAVAFAQIDAQTGDLVRCRTAVIN